MNSRRFKDAPDWQVNMTAAELRAWLRTDESKSVEFTRRGETESVGRQSARRIIRILEQGGPETALQTALRELAEETWIRNVVVDPVPLYVSDSSYVTFFWIKPRKLRSVLDHENADTGWFDFDELPGNPHPRLEETLGAVRG